MSFCRGRGTKQGTSHEFLDKGAEGLLKNSEAGCGQMLDHFLVCGGLDALLARITPSSGLECSAQKLGELLRAFEIVCDRAAPTTAPHFALSYARHLQRAAHARLRRLASSATNATKQYIDGRWDADEKIRRTCDRLARCLAQLAPDAFNVAEHIEGGPTDTYTHPYNIGQLNLPWKMIVGVDKGGTLLSGVSPIGAPTPGFTYPGGVAPGKRLYSHFGSKSDWNQGEYLFDGYRK